MLKHSNCLLDASDLEVLTNCSQLRCLCVKTKAVVQLASLAALPALTRLTSLTISVKNARTARDVWDAARFPEALLTLTKLVYLDLAGFSNIAAIPSIISTLQRLTCLKPSKYKSIRLPEQAFQHLPSLVAISLCSTSLGRYDEHRLAQHALWGDCCKRRRNSCLMYHRMMRVDRSLSLDTITCCQECTQLKKLSMQKCKLTSVPMCLTSFVELDYLDLSINSLTAFGPLSSLTKLTWLGLNSCGLQRSSELSVSKRLQKVQLKSDDLTYLPWSFPWQDLRTFLLYGNDFRQLPLGMLCLAGNLKFVCFHKNCHFQVCSILLITPWSLYCIREFAILKHWAFLV